MTTLQHDTILNQLEKDGPLSFFEKLIGKNFPVAIWRLPNQEVCHGIVDLRPEEINETKEIEEVQPGFLLNKFIHHHPSQPELIKADIIASWKRNKVEEVRQSPVLSSEKLENLSEELKKPINNNSGTSNEAHPDFQEMVSSSIEKIRAGNMSKVVLSRYEDTELPENFSPFEIFEKACSKYPNAFVYILYTPDHGTWLGATPETLISIENKRYFKTVSLAGTQKLDEDQSLNDVAWTQKEIEEQAMVSRYIIDCFKKIRLREFEEVGPKTVKAGNLAHLKTEYRVDMKDVNMIQLGSVMLDLLHPTSAVCGMPLHESLEFIKKHELYDRELYAGYLGPVNIEDHTQLFVNLRCMKIMGNTGRFYAGAGITEDSNPEKEFIETQMKMQTLKKLIFES